MKGGQFILSVEKIPLQSPEEAPGISVHFFFLPPSNYSLV